MTVTRDPAGGQQAADDDTAVTPAPKGAGDARRAAQALRAAKRRRPATEPAIEPATGVATEPATEVEAAAEPVATTTPAEAVVGAKPAVALDKRTATPADEPAAGSKPATAVTSTKTATSSATKTAKTTATKTTTTTAKTTAKTAVAARAARTATTAAAVADTDTDTDTDTDSGAAAEGTPRPPRRRPRRITAVAAVLAVLAAAFVVVAAVVNAHAQDTRTDSPARARDAALLAARQDITVLNTLDYRDVDGGLQRWADATTGTLRDQLTQVSDADKQALAVSQSVTTAKVLAAAVTQLDTARGSATVIASVQIDVTKAGAAADPKRSRFSLTMTQVAGTWKIGAVQQVGVQVS